MAFQNYSELNEIQLDVLKEIGNIGSGNAATALATMLSAPVQINVPVVRIMDFDEVIESMGGPESMIVGLLLSLDGDVNGMIMFLIEQDFAHMTLNTLLGQEISSFEEIDEMGYSALREVSNIMAASYVNAIATMTDLTINLSPPDICIDMLGSILSVPAIHYANISDKIIVIQDEMKSEDVNSANHILLIPDVASLQRIMQMLGLEL